MLNLERIQTNLNTRYIGRSILPFDELDSTNSQALRLHRSNITNGLVIVTDKQTGGRGRRGNNWHSTPGKSLTFSVIIFPDVPLINSGLLSLLAGVAVAETMEKYDIEAKLKWPNDIIIFDKKIGGLLCETRVVQNQVDTFVIGIGLNINEDRIDFPETIVNSATSVKIILNKIVQRESVLIHLLSQLETWIDHIENKDKIISTWLARCAHLEQVISIKIKGNTVSGIFSGLTDYGEAIIETNGKETIISAGIVTI
ncbi:MAG: biotin--[acetyl-CoA-carboxylase] ligase [Candidatus Neomarinimicrobiota bacterium]